MKVAIAWVIMFALLVVFLPQASAQWNYDELEPLLKTGCTSFDSLDQCVEEITHAIRINFGVTAIEQLPYLNELFESQKATDQYAQALDTSSRILWLLNKNTGQIANSREVLVAHLFDTERPECFERVMALYAKDTGGCVRERYFAADILMAASRLQERIAEETQGLEDYRLLAMITTTIHDVVLGIAGPPTIFFYDNRLQEYIERPDPTIDPKYTQAVWEYKTMKVAKRIKEIENEQGK